MTRPSIYRHAGRLIQSRVQYATPLSAPAQHCRALATGRPAAGNAGPSPTSISPHQRAPRAFSSSSSAATASSSSSPDPFSTVNADEISHFTRLSSEWWSPTGEFALLHRMNPARVEYIRQKLMHINEPEWTFATRHDRPAQPRQAEGVGKWLAGMDVLDVGCGGGLLAESLARLGGDVLAIDAGQQNIEIARIHAQADPFLPLDRPRGVTGVDRSRLEYRCVPAERLREEGKQYDVVTSMEVIEHVDEPGEFLKCLGDMVKPGGHLILSTISRTPLSQLLTLTLAEDVLRLVTPGTHTYSKFIKPEELRRFVYEEMGGYAVWERNKDGSDVRQDQVGETRGIVYNPLKGAWELWAGAEGSWGKEAGELCNYMFYARKRADAV